jgi:hypothetical protein
MRWSQQGVARSQTLWTGPGGGERSMRLAGGYLGLDCRSDSERRGRSIRIRGDPIHPRRLIARWRRRNRRTWRRRCVGGWVRGGRGAESGLGERRGAWGTSPTTSRGGGGGVGKSGGLLPGHAARAGFLASQIRKPGVMPQGPSRLPLSLAACPSHPLYNSSTQVKEFPLLCPLSSSRRPMAHQRLFYIKSNLQCDRRRRIVGPRATNRTWGVNERCAAEAESRRQQWTRWKDEQRVIETAEPTQMKPAKHSSTSFRANV